MRKVFGNISELRVDIVSLRPMEQTSDLFGDSMGAEFSPCRKYRYRLWRIWDDRPVCLFVGAVMDDCDPAGLSHLQNAIAKQVRRAGIRRPSLFIRGGPVVV